MNPHFVSSVTSQFIAHSGDVGLHQKEASDWQAKAVAVYTSTTDATSLRLRRRLAERLLALTGHVVPAEAIAVDAVGRSASAVVDGVLFLLRREDVLAIVRACAYCETGRFVSEPLDRQSDLGYALAVWEPYHRDCEPEDPPDDVSW
jgi:hypothetical protein